jgi:hypothetical protein
MTFIFKPMEDEMSKPEAKGFFNTAALVAKDKASTYFAIAMTAMATLGTVIESGGLTGEQVLFLAAGGLALKAAVGAMKVTSNSGMVFHERGARDATDEDHPTFKAGNMIFHRRVD